MAIWFVEIRDKGDDYVTRYIPVKAVLQSDAATAGDWRGAPLASLYKRLAVLRWQSKCHSL